MGFIRKQSSKVHINEIGCRIKYGPLVEQSIEGDSQQLEGCRHKYESIDSVYTQYIAKLLELWRFEDVTKEEKIKFFISEQSKGGLDLVLPGVYFTIMKATY